MQRLLHRHRRLRSLPGERTRYSNLGYLVLGEVIAHASGRPYERYMREQLLAPSGMVHTGYSCQDTGPCRPATGYQPLSSILTPLLRAVLPAGIVDGRYGRYVVYHPFHVSGTPYGGLVGPVTDAARLALLHLGDGTIDGVRLMSSQAVIATRHVVAAGGPVDVGLGWHQPTGTGDSSNTTAAAAASLP